MHQKTILLAEPDTQSRNMLRRGLEGMGYNIMEAGSGRNALDMCLRSEVSLAITELYLATESERCLVRAIGRSAALRRMKVLAYTSHGADADREWALLCGADAYLVKPTRLGRLLQVASRLASSRTSTRRDARLAGR
ncbi:MAG TPA: response regulator [Gemmatimonadaceae bacterium]|nr:response regulator [Gemmatimonadaceae bacterium]